MKTTAKEPVTKVAALNLQRIHLTQYLRQSVVTLFRHPRNGATSSADDLPNDWLCPDWSTFGRSACTHGDGFTQRLARAVPPTLRGRLEYLALDYSLARAYHYGWQIPYALEAPGNLHTRYIALRLERSEPT